MTVFRYKAMNAKGENASGVIDLQDKNALDLYLKEKELFLISSHEVSPTPPEAPPLEAPQPAPAAAQDPTPDHWREKKSKWPEMGPKHYMIMGIIFAGCVFAGYLIGR